MEQLGGDGIDAEGADGVGNLLSIFWSGCVSRHEPWQWCRMAE